jgi:hypothetical protein
VTLLSDEEELDLDSIMDILPVRIRGRVLRHLRGEDEDDDPDEPENDTLSYEDRVRLAREAMPKPEPVEPPVFYIDPEAYAERFVRRGSRHGDPPTINEVLDWWRNRG